MAEDAKKPAGPTEVTSLRNARIYGSGYTKIKWGWNVGGAGVKTDGTQFHDLIYAQQLSHTSPSPVVQPQVIQPINALRPVEIVTTKAIGHGQITLQLIEVFAAPIWDQLAGLVGSNDIADVLKAVSEMDGKLQVLTVINPPDSSKNYQVMYHDCVVADVRDDETWDNTTLSLNKQVTLWYRFSVFNQRNA